MGQLVTLRQRFAVVGGSRRSLRTLPGQIVGAVLQALRVPGLIRPMQYEDAATGRRIAVRTSSRYTVLAVDGREYFFDRDSGAFDGTGSGTCEHCERQPTLNS